MFKKLCKCDQNIFFFFVLINFKPKLWMKWLRCEWITIIENDEKNW